MTVNFANVGDGLAALATMRQQADELARAIPALTDDLTRHAAEVGQPLATQLDEAARLSDEVFETMRPHSGQFGEFTPVPEAIRASGVQKLEEAIRLHGTVAQGIDDAFGAGTWMSKSVRETRGFHDEARRVLADPTLGPGSADHAIDLLRTNGYSYDEAARTLRTGDLARMNNRQMFQVIDDATPEALESAASWRTVYTPSPAA